MPKKQINEKGKKKEEQDLLEMKKKFMKIISGEKTKQKKFLKNCENGLTIKNSLTSLLRFICSLVRLAGLVSQNQTNKSKQD